MMDLGACMRGIAVAAAALAGPGAAWAAGAADILARATNADGVFEALPDGSLRHVQSGLVCPARFPNVELGQIGVFPSAEFGGDVGCDYGRPGPDGAPVSKLAIYATKVAPGDTLEAMFEQRKLEIQYAMPAAILAGPAIPAELGSALSKGAGGMMSAQYAAEQRGMPVLTDLIVAVKGEWQIKIRATYPAPPQGQANDDTPGPVNAWLKAMETVGAARP